MSCVSWLGLGDFMRLLVQSPPSSRAQPRGSLLRVRATIPGGLGAECVFVSFALFRGSRGVAWRFRASLVGLGWFWGVLGCFRGRGPGLESSWNLQ